MFFVDDVMIAEGLKVARFACKLGQCKGACCVEGEQGGPLTVEESHWIQKNIKSVLPYMKSECRDLVEKRGPVHRSESVDHTPLNGTGGPCIYLVQDESGTGRCLFEKLGSEGIIDFSKPISCHLYPLLYKETRYYKMLSYERRGVCLSSWNQGPLLIEFEKEALIRKFGPEFTQRLIQSVQQAKKKDL